MSLNAIGLKLRKNVVQLYYNAAEIRIRKSNSLKEF